MVSRSGDLSPAGCRGSFSRCSRSENGGGGGTERVPRKILLVLGFLIRGQYIGEGGHRGPPRAARRPPGVTQGGAAPGTLLGAWWWPSSPLLILPESSITLIFYIFFMDFFGHFNQPENLKNKNSRNRELATGCTELIG